MVRATSTWVGVSSGSAATTTVSSSTAQGSLSGDRQRHNEIAESGWRMYYPTAPDVYQHSTPFLAKIAAALHEAGCTTIGQKLTPAAVPRPAGELLETCCSGRGDSGRGRLDQAQPESR